MTLDEIVSQVAQNGVRDVVLTGGEPMLFDAIVPLAHQLRALGHRITIETAGTVWRELPCDLMSISPKLKNSIPVGDAWQARHDATRLNTEVLRNLMGHYEHQLKFVVNPEGSPDDLSDIQDLLATLEADRSRVLLMPEGTDSETLWRRARLLVPLCIEYGFRLAPRMHVDLFGHTRGT